MTKASVPTNRGLQMTRDGLKDAWLPGGAQHAELEGGTALLDDGLGFAPDDAHETDPDQPRAQVYEMPADAAEKAVAIIEKANKRAEKAGVTERFNYEIEYDVVADGEDSDGLAVYKEIARVTIDRPTIEHEGWKFVGTLGWDDEVGLVTRLVPGEELTARPEAKLCDVCGKKRNRNDTYVVQRDGENGPEQLQVGSDCMEQFLGMRPKGLWMLSEDFDFSHLTGGGYGTRTEPRYDRNQVLGIAIAAARRYGWTPTSRATEDNEATAQIVRTAMFSPARTPEDSELISEGVRRQDEIGDYLSYAEAMEGDSEYVTNLRAVLSAETVTSRNIGLLVSAIGAKHRAEAQAAKAARTSASQWLGQEKDKVPDTPVEVLEVKYFDGDYGTTSRISFVDGSGNVMQWWASGYKEVEPGEKLLLRGTIKKLDEYNGVKQTVLTRAKMTFPDEAE